MISTFTAFFDANVFYGARLRSLLLYLAQTKQFRARWSDRVHDEWIRNLKANRPDIASDKIDKIRQSMNNAILDCLVTGYEPLIPCMGLPDPNDNHILAAAIVGKASCIVTFNLDDFPARIVERYGLHAVHPDRFILDVENLSPVTFAKAVAEDFSHYVDPQLTLNDYTASLRKAGLPQTAERIEKLAVLIDRPDPARHEV
ncbi:MAG TPA: PIN domain-containing protein [Acidiphilium sp.]